MADHTINIDVYDISVPELNPINIAIINLPNPVTDYSANAKEVRDLIQIPKYTIYESGTSNVINGTNYFDYFPEEGGGGGGGGGVTPEEVQAMIAASIDTAISESSDNAIANSTITNFVNSSISTATADFKGTYNSLDDLEIVPANKNDYAFLRTTDTAGNTIYKRYKYTEIEDSHPLPEGYTRIAYLKSTGTQVIDTGINVSSKTKVSLKIDSINADGYNGIFGAKGYVPAEGTNCYFQMEAAGNGSYIAVDLGFSKRYEGVDNSKPLEFEYDYPKLIINGEPDIVSSTHEFTFTTPGTTLAVFGEHYDGSYTNNCKCTLFSFSMENENGESICELVPCRNSNDEVGMYDLVNERFLGNVGTGAFIGGPAASGMWEFEYELNNSSYTAEQWAAINSGIKSSDVSQIGTNALNITKLQADMAKVGTTFRGIFTTQQAMDATVADKNDTAILQSTDTDGNTVYTMHSYVTIEGSDLPTGYTQLLYIASDGDQCIDTGVNLSSTRGFYLKFMPIGENNNESSFGLWGFDNRNYSVNYRMYYYDSKYYLQYAEGTPEINVITNTINEVEFKPRVLTVNGESVTIADQGEWYFSGANTAALFAYKSNGSGYAGKSTMRLYECKLYDNDKTTLLRHFIPVRNPNNEIGLYDTVEGQFYSNQGTGSFTAGPAADGYWVSQYSFLASIQGSLDAINTIIEGVL